MPGLTTHGLRHSFSSTVEDLGFTIPTMKALLGHSAGSVTEGYIHKIDSALVSAATRVAHQIHSLMSGEQEQRVIPLRTA